MKNWNTFHRRININATRQEIYDAWTKTRGIESWFLRKAELILNENSIVQMEDNAEYKWEWYGHPNYFESGKVVSADGESKLEFTFNGCLVCVEIFEEMGENICKLTQSGIPACDTMNDNLVVACGQGWTFYMANLKSFLEGGIDLRNQNDHLKNMLNA